MEPQSPFDRHLRRALENHLDVETGATPPNLAEAMAYSLLLPGKRIRPRLTLACAQMVGLVEAASIPAAVAVETLHCFTLIHDDLPCMDNSDTRRGKPANHKVHGEGLALLAGDALIALAYKALFEAAPHVTATGFHAALNRFTDTLGASGVTGGQAMEMLLKPDSGPDAVRKMHAAKTGALFKAALLLPKDLSEVAAEGDGGQSIITFADELGSAFQVADDLADLAEEKGDRASFNVFNHGDKGFLLNEATTGLEIATRQLHEIWGESAAGLVAISNEVKARLR
ncbi:MAG: polyprenyl synthetase family protein [Bdellovibrionales bacterium]|nr:polyprenyl synthetase family protein [Bdellovibrionales bacterium]